MSPGINFKSIKRSRPLPAHSTKGRLGLAMLCALGLVSTPAGWAADKDALPLPQWVPPTAKPANPGPLEPLKLGGGLWPKGTEGAEAPEGTGAGATGGNQAPEENKGGFANFFKLFIPQPPSPPLPPLPSPQVRIKPAEPVSEAVFQAILDAAPDTYFLDPQGLVSEAQGEDMRRLLNDHANGARFAMFLLVLGPGQDLPDKSDVGQVASGALLHRLSWLAVYPMGEPWRARMFTSREITKASSSTYLATMSEECIRDAMRSQDDIGQLQRFATQLSTRLYWLEKACHLPAHRSEVPEPPPVSTPSTSARPDPIPEPLPEVETRVSDQIVLLALARSWLPVVLRAGVLLALLLTLALVVRSLLRRRRRRLRQSVWLLPEAEITRRLGAPHCGGCGAAVKYG